MKTEHRWEEIVKLVNQRGYLTVQELSGLCETSLITIRRDLMHLDSLNRLRRTHGGAASLHSSTDIPPPTQAANGEHAEQPLSERFDALITADILPRFASLIHKPDGETRIPAVAESLPLPDTHTYVSVDNYQAGYDLGMWAADYAIQHWQGQANILDLTYHRPNTQARSQGFLDGLRQILPGANLMLSINTQSRYDMAYQLTRDALLVHGGINIIFAMNDISAYGAYRACKDLKIKPGRLVILTFGVESAKMIDLIQQGDWIVAGIGMFPEIIGTICVEAAIAAYNHQSLPPQLVTPYCIITKDTIQELYKKAPGGWKLQWDKIPCEIQLPLQVNINRPDYTRPLPARLGFVVTFVEHDWYKSLAAVMKEYTERLGIRLEIVDFAQTVKDELHLRRIEIARRAALEIKPGDTIFIDGGVISRELAERIPNISDLTVITNSMAVLEVLKEKPNITLLSTGGALRRSSQVFVGPTAESTIKELHIDKLFLMVSGVSKDFSLSHTNISEVTIKQIMIRSAQEVILLADYSSFQQEALIQVAPVTVLHKIISDDALPASIRLELGKLGISVILAAM